MIHNISRTAWRRTATRLSDSVGFSNLFLSYLKSGVAKATAGHQVIREDDITFEYSWFR